MSKHVATRSGPRVVRPSQIAGGSLFLVVALIAAGCSGGSTSDGSDSTQVSAPATSTEAAGAEGAAEQQDLGTLEWGPCDEASAISPDKECATLQVPLDHADPDGERIAIAVARIATSGADRIGSLVFNPGGPGGSGVEFLDQATVIVPTEVAERFDLVSFDPRGVGASTALDCDVEIDDNVTLLDAGDDAGWDRLVAETDDIETDCTADTLELARYVGTNNAARDLDLLREALGDDGLTYVGYSYGTRLGATYAELFPDRVRALVLDAAVKPTDDSHELDLGQAEGFDRALENFAAACDADQDCILQDVGPTLEVLDGLRTEIAEVGEFETDDADRVLTPGELELGIIASLYSKETWPFLAQAIFVAEAEQDGSLFQVLGDQYAGRRVDGTYDNSQVANGFINCADDPARPDADETRRLADETAALSVLFDEVLRASTGCLGIEPALDPLIIGPAEGAPPILVIGNSGDPATPFEWSEAMAESLASAVLFTVDAEGHTAYGSIECVTEPVNAYLIDLDVPDVGASCSDNTDADFFVPEGDSEVDLIITLFDCLRDNGLDIPPIGTADILADPSGEGFTDFLDPTDPAFIAAIGACEDALLALQGA